MLEKHLIWPNLGKLYGTESLHELQDVSRSLSTDSILNDETLRRIHLQSRLRAFQTKLQECTDEILADTELITAVEDLCDRLHMIAVEMEEIDRQLENHDTDLTQISNQHQEITKDFDGLCQHLSDVIENLCTSENSFAISMYGRDKDNFHQCYNVKKQTNLSTKRNMNSVDAAIEDLSSRQQLLTLNINAISQLLPSNAPSNQDFQNLLASAKEKLEKIDHVTDELNYLRSNFRSIEKCTKNYLSLLLTDDRLDIPGSKFIYLLERLRHRTEQIEAMQNFPNTFRLMNEWQNDYGIGDGFKPKVLDACKVIEKDLEVLFTEQKSIYTIPYRIGVVGNSSVGKSALIIKLGNFIEYSSVVNLERSTFGYLPFDSYFEYNLPTAKKIPISFIDIAGAIDNDTVRSIGNYIELIENADCDLYMLVFDNLFDQFNESCLKHIQDKLHRKCLLVRSKADLLFHQFYREKNGRSFQSGSSNKHHMRSALEKTRDHSLKNYEKKLLKGYVFLTAAGDDNRFTGEEFGQFDLEKLKEELKRSALTDMRLARIIRLAIFTARTLINTCFRRGYVVSQTKYCILAAVTSILPFLDEIPSFAAREKIRQAFGIHDRYSVINFVRRKTNSLEQYLTKYQLTIPERLLQSGHFTYTVSKDKKVARVVTEESIESVEPRPQTYENNIDELPLTLAQKEVAAIFHYSNFLKQSMVVGGAVVQSVDDILRIGVSSTAGALRGLSIAGIVVGAVLIPVFAAWSAYSTRKRMKRHLHLLCDDLQFIFVYLIIRIGVEYSANKPCVNYSSFNEEQASPVVD